MRWLNFTATAVLVGLMACGPAATARAQPAPPAAAPPAAAPPADGPPGPGPGFRQRGMGGPSRAYMGNDMGERPMMGLHQRQIDPSVFGLMYHPDDRKLTQPEVRKIAESLLLWFGNRTWQVTEVAPAADGVIGFAYATQDGSVIARFTMDTRTGRVARTG